MTEAASYVPAKNNSQGYNAVLTFVSCEIHDAKLKLEFRCIIDAIR